MVNGVEPQRPGRSVAVIRGTDVRARNRRVVLDIVERDGPISRADIARRAGLSTPSTSEIVEDLLASGLVVWSGEGESTGGRRPLLLRFNPARGTVLAADLGGTTPTLGLFLLDGTCLAEQRLAIPEAARGDDVVAYIVEGARRLVLEEATAYPPVLGMGVAAPGVTDPETGEVTLAPAVGWTGTPVRKLLARELGIPVAVDNDVNAAALAEWRFGEGARYQSFAFVSIGTGVGMGIILNGRVHRGWRNQAGEIGYMLTSPQGTTDPGGFGDLEARIALSAVTREYVRISGAGDEGCLDPELAFGRLLTDAASGRREAVTLLDEYTRRLSLAIVNIFVVLAPEAIFLGGPISPYVPALKPRLEAEIRRLVPFRPVLLRSTLQHRAGLVGACALASDMVKEALLAGVSTGRAADAAAALGAGVPRGGSR